MYADRKGWPLLSVEVGLRLLGGAGAMTIDRTLTIAGLDAEQRARIADIAERTPVTLTLKGGMPITTRLFERRSRFRHEGGRGCGKDAPGLGTQPLLRRVPGPEEKLG